MNKEDSGNAVKRDLTGIPLKSQEKGITLPLVTGDVSKARDTGTEIPDFLLTHVSKPLVTGDVSKSTDIDIEILTFLTTYVSKKYLEKGIHPSTLLTSLVSILRKPVAVDVLSFFIIHGAATVNTLREKLPGYSERAIYRILEFLESRGLVVKTGLVNTEGRRARVYALRGYAAEDLMIARERDRLARSPIYTEVNRIVQLLLDDHLIHISRGNTLGGRVYTSEINPIVRRENRGGFAVRTLIDRVHARIRKQGLAVL